VTATLGILAAVATLACLGTLVWVHLRPTGYDPLQDTVSDYGVGTSYPFYRAQTAAMALAAILVAAALAKAIDPAPRRAIVLLLVFAAARLAIPSFPTDLDRAQRTRTGLIHILLAAVAFASIAWGGRDPARPRGLARVPCVRLRGRRHRGRHRLRGAEAVSVLRRGRAALLRRDAGLVLLRLPQPRLERLTPEGRDRRGDDLFVDLVEAQSRMEDNPDDELVLEPLAIQEL
jgi:Protein of unknown function (DUF998)